MKGIQLSNRSEKPFYQQLHEQISAQILRGELAADFALPPIRTAAAELRVSIITVKKAWEELERAGLIYSVTGRGCFVADLASGGRENRREEILKQRLERDREFYLGMGVDKKEMIRLVEKYYQADSQIR